MLIDPIRKAHGASRDDCWSNPGPPDHFHEIGSEQTRAEKEFCDTSLINKVFAI
jgi:hypothetical protein